MSDQSTPLNPVVDSIAWRDVDHPRPVWKPIPTRPPAMMAALRATVTAIAAVAAGATTFFSVFYVAAGLVLPATSQPGDHGAGLMIAGAVGLVCAGVASALVASRVATSTARSM